jgi:hypothetical protein
MPFLAVVVCCARPNSTLQVNKVRSKKRSNSAQNFAVRFVQKVSIPSSDKIRSLRKNNLKEMSPSPNTPKKLAALKSRFEIKFQCVEIGRLAINSATSDSQNSIRPEW